MASITLNKNSVPGEIRPWPFFFRSVSIPSPLSPSLYHIILNCVGDKSALVPGGIRIGSPAMTTRGFTEKEFVATADYIHEGVQITIEAKKSVSGSKLQDFLKFVASPEFALKDKVADLQTRVEALTTQFPIPGVWASWLGYIGCCYVACNLIYCPPIPKS